MQKELVVNTEKGTEEMEHKFNQKFEKNLQAHHTNLKSPLRGGETVS